MYNVPVAEVKSYAEWKSSEKTVFRSKKFWPATYV